jgi:hypothetical protein
MNPDAVETHRTTRTILAIAAVLLLVAGGLAAAQYAGPANAQFATAAAVLAVVTLVAVGIERVIEIGWTIFGQLGRFGAWWPVNQVTNRAKELETELNKELAGLVEKGAKILDDSGKLVEDAEKLVDASDQWIVKAMKQLQEIQKAAPGNQQVNLVAANAQLLLNQIAATKPGVQAKLGVAEQTIDGLLDFVAAFKENPARRLISLYVGMLLGLIVASVLRMDLFCAAGEATACAAQGLKLALPGLGPDSEILRYWPVALTGLLIGLGSNPTHEVIKYIQESKKSQKALNGPIVITRTVTEEAAPAGPAGPTDAAALSSAAGERETLRGAQPGKRTTRTLFLR